MKRYPALALVLILALLVPVLAQVQSPKQQERTSDDDDVVRITTNLIQVDAVVTDKNGKLVTDLTAEDFEIEENDEKQQITNFSYVPLAAEAVKSIEANPPADPNAPTVPRTRLRPDQVRRSFAFVVDDLGLSFLSTSYVRKVLKKFVDEQMQPGDMVAILRTAGGVGSLQQFTSDKRVLYEAIERLRWNSLGRGGISPITPMEGRNITDQVLAELPRASNNGSNLDGELNKFRDTLSSSDTLAALKYIINGLRELPGRKSLLFVSDGLTGTNLKRKTPSDSQTVGADWEFTDLSDSIRDALRRITELANRASVVLYTMDARGLQSLVMTADDDVSGLSFQQVQSNLFNRRNDFSDSQKPLVFLAQQTGGLAITNTNDLSGGIQKMLDDQKGYYLIGYHPNEKSFDPNRARFNKLKVTVKKSGFKVRYRSGFFGITDKEMRPAPPVTRAEQLARAVVTPFASGELNVQLTLLFANDETSGSFMRSLLHVDASKLTFTEEPDGWRKLVFDIMAVTFGDDGNVVDEVSRTENVRMRGGTYRLIMQNGFDYIINVPIKKPGAYQLRTALRDTVTERVGSASQFVTVPDLSKGRLALSGIVINGYDADKLKKFTEAGNGAVVKPSNEPLSGPGVRRLWRGLVMDFGYVIYNAHLDKSTLRPQLQTQIRLFRDGRQVFAGDVLPFDPGSQADLKRLTSGGQLQLGTDMEPGDYVLQIIVTDLLAKEKQRTAVQWIDFQISDK